MNTATSKRLEPTRDVDVRGFVYALEPVRQQQQWRMDKLMSALARAQQALIEIHARMGEVLGLHDEQAQRSGEALLHSMDPGAHRLALGFLTQLRGEWKQLDAQRKEQILERDRLRKACMALQLRLDGMTQHKEDALTQYANDIRQRESNEHDRDWLARSAVGLGRVRAPSR